MGNAEQPTAAVVGFIDAYDDGTLVGWAARPGDQGAVALDVREGGRTIGTVSASLYREDLRAAGIGDGRHGFWFVVPDDVRSRGEYSLDVTERATGVPLGHSPFRIQEDADRPLKGGGRLRRFLAEQYISGQGLEIGALHRPLPVPASAQVRYADAFPTDELARLWSPEVDGHQLVPVDIITDATTLSGVADETMDFVIANHVVEHLEDPIRCVMNLLRVTRPGGCVFLAIPDRRHTFDAKRPPTSLDHVTKDYCGDPAWARHAHYVEWVALVEGLAAEAAVARVSKLEAERYPIHFHVWDPTAFGELLAEIRVLSVAPFDVDLYKANPPEAIWILRRL